jgi:hypothetical protein
MALTQGSGSPDGGFGERSSDLLLANFADFAGSKIHRRLKGIALQVLVVRIVLVTSATDERPPTPATELVGFCLNNGRGFHSRLLFPEWTV